MSREEISRRVEVSAGIADSVYKLVHENHRYSRQIYLLSILKRIW